jgi:alkanesulfonate monooxygenase SsuD/methylene tetrahydromethanopterin reductase-like flavin-dependent oxidoreductase (luciferase family)
MRQVFIAKTTAEAEAIAAPAVNHLYREVYGKASAAGDRTLRADDGSVITDFNQVGFENFKDRYIIGDPDFAIEAIKRYEAACDPSEIVCWMHMPGIRGDVAMKSVELFAREVMPHFQ